METILQTFQLSKHYGEYRAVNQVSMTIQKGDIYGFLGPNGAGKTTTIRMILGLIKPSGGRIEIFGTSISPNEKSHLERIGSIIEVPGFYSNLTAVENLEVHRRMLGVPKRDCIEKALELVDLKEQRNKKVKNMSLGMKQRLGVARALLHEPELLILDEPTNGLDPAGIRDMRKLLKTLAEQKKITILISSHILAEVQQLANKIGIIHQGKLVEEIDWKALQAKNRHYLELVVTDDKKTTFLLEQKLGLLDFKVVESGRVRLYEKIESPAMINRFLIENEIDVKELQLKNDSLEDYFLRLTGGEQYVS